MAKFKSDIINIQTPPEKIFSFLDDLNNLRLIMPEQVENWTSDDDECSFFIRNLGNLGLKKGRTSFPEKISFASSSQSKVTFELIFSLNPMGNENHSASFEVIAEMNSMVEMMAKRPLTNFVNLLITNLKTQFDNK
jgi:carbon monoxide dehydrogenase subunit G